MQTPPISGFTATTQNDIRRDWHPTCVAWGPIIAGAFTIAALTFMLLSLGTGIGFASVSPWANEGVSAGAFTMIAAIWLIIVQWVSSGLGGYLTGRLRSKWVNMHDHEVYFRDTAHGFLSWAVATVIGATLFASFAAGHHHAMRGPGPEEMGGPLAYSVDNLYRADHVVMIEPETRGESTRILAMGLKNGDVPESDKTYLAQLVAAKTGLAQPDAQKRVDDVITQEKVAEAKAQKVAASVAIYLFLSMMIGAFIASASAAAGGHHRDQF